MRIERLLTATVVGLSLGACATIVKGTSESIAITTPPTSGANCTLSSGQRNWTMVSPGAVTVEKSKDDIQVRCTKPGWQDAVGNIPSNFEGWTVGNILIGGLIGFGIDAASGAINEYPHAFQVPMTRAEGAAPEKPPTSENKGAPTS